MERSSSDFDHSQREMQLNYLILLAQLQFDHRLRDNLDLPGIVQQSLFEALQAVPEAKIEIAAAAALLAWLKKILANQFADEIRKVTNLKVIEYLEHGLKGGLDQSSSVLFDASLSKLQIEKSLSQLPAAEREAIFLKFWEHKSLTEIAELMSRTPAAVAALLKRGLHKLRGDK